jgi:hypothetical protein
MATETITEPVELRSTVDPPQIQQKKEKITTTLNNINTINQNWYK